MQYEEFPGSKSRADAIFPFETISFETMADPNKFFALILYLLLDLGRHSM